MNYLRYLALLLALLGLSSCNQEKIEELESQVSRLESENRTLKSHIEELEEANRQQQEVEWQQQEMKMHQQNAQQHLRDAEFWRQTGDEFLYENSMRQAQQELYMMP